MSIFKKSQAQGSTSSPSFDSSPPLNPDLDHGSSLSPPSPLPQSPPSLSRQFSSGSSLAAAENPGESSRKVSEFVAPNGKRCLPLQNGEYHSGGRGFGLAQSKGKMSGAIASDGGQHNAGSINALGSRAKSSGRRSQMMNANHLLNFHYDPIARPQPRTPPPPPPRRQQKIKPYKKDLFLQANYKFVLLDTGNYAPESMDPDKMLNWHEIIFVRYSTPFPVQCPICLEYPLCPQITSCGHIFCFPCIIQYLLMGEENHKVDCFKRCPLCFVMVSQKDLYTIYIENVKHYHVGDTMEFMLLTRQKDSFSPLQKNKQDNNAKPSCDEDVYDPFSKFTFTSDVELSVRKAISDLDGWLARADSGLVDDLEKLPYFCAAMEQLEQRKKYWNDQKASSKHKSNKYICNNRGSQALLSTANATTADQEACSSSPTPSVDVNCQAKWSDNEIMNVVEQLEGQDAKFSSCEENKNFQRPSNSSKDTDSYNFYQAVDGQHFILHPLNMKCLLQHYGNFDLLPHRISGKILQLETVTQSEAIRRRYHYLSHFSLTTTFQLCEIDLSEMFPPDALSPFMDEIKRREKQRKQLAKKERKEQIKAEAAAAAAYSIPILSSIGQCSNCDPPEFSMDDFEALGSSPAISSSPPIAGERILFSNVARLGFAAGHDSPTLKIEGSSTLHNVANDSSGVTGLQNSGTPSFANVISKAKSGDNTDATKVNNIGKKGKKPSRVLLSTASGRRY